jgi:hypothetical protein
MKKIKLNTAEIQSKRNRVEWAEGLILQLPDNHDGRNSWLMNYGKDKEAQGLRDNRKLTWNEKTQSSELSY